MPYCFMTTTEIASLKKKKKNYRESFLPKNENVKTILKKNYEFLENILLLYIEKYNINLFSKYVYN